MQDREIVDGKVVIKKPGFECPAIILSVILWVIFLLYWLGGHR